MPLSLPLSCPTVLNKIIAPALELLPGKMLSDAADVMLLSIGMQESDFNYREQQGGPARGLWQFERGTAASHGGVWGVLNHPATRKGAIELCARRGCPVSAGSVYLALAGDDILAAGIARLLLWTDPHQLPDVTDADGAWALYLRTWRPGKPRPDAWPECHAAALRAVHAQACECDCAE